MENYILPKKLEKYTHIVDGKIEWCVEKFDNDVPLQGMSERFYHAHTNEWMTTLTIAKGRTQFSNGNTDVILLKIAANNYNLLTLQPQKLDDNKSPPLNCNFDAISGNCDAACYLVDLYLVCERCYNLIMSARENLIEIKPKEYNSHNLTIFKVDNFVPSDGGNVNYSGIAIRRSEDFECKIYIFKNYIESINVYHPKLININPDYSCYICAQSKELEQNHLYCWCSRFVSQIFASFYFPKASLIKWIDSFQGIYLPKDINNVILDYFTEICKIQNYTDNELLKIDEYRFIEHED